MNVMAVVQNPQQRALAQEIESDRVAEILRLGREAAILKSYLDGEPQRSEVVFWAINSAMQTLNRLPDRETGWLYCIRSMQPEIVHDYSDRLEAWETQLERIKLGELAVEALVPRSSPPSPQAISRMEQIFTWHRFLLKNPRRVRDWKVLCLYAGGLSSRKVARICHISDRTVRDTAVLQTTTMAGRLVEAYGEAVFPQNAPT